MSYKRYEYNGIVYKAELDSIFNGCQGKEVYLYGYGLYGHFMECQLKKREINVNGIIVSDLDYKQQLKKNPCDFPIIVIDEFEYNDNKVIIICGDHKNASEMSKRLKNNKIESFYRLELTAVDKQIVPVEGQFSKEDCYATLQDATIRLRITNRCPGKCDFCGQKNWSDEFQNMEMDPKIYYEYLEPIYDQIKMILITGGDAFFAKNSYDYMKYICEKYPHITIVTESNGLTFSDKFQKLACDHLFTTHFSVNASNMEVFRRGCWSSEGGDNAWNTIESNIKAYLKLLDSNRKLCFAPSTSMVVSTETVDDVVEFVIYSLKNHFRKIRFYFDYEINDVNLDLFSNTDVFRPALIKLLEIKKMLKDHFLIDISWVPFKEMDSAEKRVSIENETELRKKYPIVWEYGSRRDEKKEYEERAGYRKEYGKKYLSFEEDANTSLRGVTIQSQKTCFSPWSFIDLWPDGSMDICGWRGPAFFVHDYVKGNKVDWMEFFNSEEIRLLRANMLNGSYDNCLPCCPIIREVI